MKTIRLNDASQGIETVSIENQVFFKITNVESYEFCTIESFIVQINEVPSTENNDEYFIIDTLYNEAVSHWVYESSIYLEAFNYLYKINNNIKLHLKTMKNYKKIICNYFGISENCIVYDIDSSKPNTCYFPKYSKSTNMHLVDTNYIMNIDKLYESFNKNTISSQKSVDICLLPRQSKENYVTNDRIISVNLLIDYLNNSKKYSFDILESDRIDRFIDQIERVKAASIIILSDGAALSINGIFCKDKKILVIGNFSLDQEKHHPRGKFIATKIREQNEVFYFDNQEGVLKYLEELSM
jgi:hypothetical protein